MRLFNLRRKNREENVEKIRASLSASLDAFIIDNGLAPTIRPYLLQEAREIVVDRGRCEAAGVPYADTDNPKYYRKLLDAAYQTIKLLYPNRNWGMSLL